ncbi:minor extracellular protease vpr [Magnaporthiopsis poae ATCC 64411]|uniref:Minor extracellular protease vpr n=1 Tax=Magnaporthiopsis poae (strain ATCC 64411 / 73-15) TaxID=644358 RepID=A0A0C4CSJ1_MAGP6|nr:minor extracellular protease vpr, variant [Magnaporthiopsis poae ATCC 64411]KLU90352.1 minor extracellular protease vpr [Magnaporthiopsis poae ATCC 64411]
MVRAALVLSLFATACTAQIPAKPVEKGTASVQRNTAQIVKGAYIVEYEEGHNDPAAFKDKISKDGEVKMDLNSKLFTGASIILHDKERCEETIQKVAALPAVRRVWPVMRYQPPEYTVEWSGNVPDAQSRELMRRQNAAANDTFSPHVMTQVNQLRDAGIRGKGIKIAIVDSGVDWKHEALGGCFGPGCLVSFGYDLVGDAYNATNTPVPDSDPMDCGGHGTHVAGIIAAQTNNPFGIVGAATDVTLGMFRVFGCNGGAQDDVLIKAFGMAYESGADIISASLGGTRGWAEGASAAVVSRIVALGVPCTFSAGNSGPKGLFFSSNPADGHGVTSIASFDNTLSPTLYTVAKYTIEGAAEADFGFVLSGVDAWANVTYPLYSIGFDTTDPANGCNPLPADTPDLTNYVVLIRRGTCAFTQKAANAVAKGARYVLIYNNTPLGAIVMKLEGVPGLLAGASVDAKTGVTWVEALKAGKKVTVAMVDPNSARKTLDVQVNNVTGGYPSDYTSWGPTFEGQMKPQFGAPGGNILSTYPRAKGGYAVMSGTSMACPLTAAVYALIMQVRATKDPRTIENLLSSTAKPTMFNNGQGAVSPLLAPVAQQGGGLLQARDAAYATTLLSTSGISFNDTDNFQPVQNFTISNTADKAITYTLSNLGAGTAYTFADSKALYPDAFPNEIVASYATLNFSEASFTIPAGGRKQLGLTVTPPTGLDASRLAVYSGYVVVNGSDGSHLSLPYQGIYGSLHSHATLDPANTYLASFRPADNSTGASEGGDDGPPLPPAVAANLTFTLPPRGVENVTEYPYASLVEQPNLAVTSPFGTPYVKVDVVPLDVCGGKEAANATTSLGVETIGMPDGFPLSYQPRGRWTSPWTGLLANGSYAPPGVYKFVVRSLRIFGNPDNATEYDTAETVPFRIRYLKA